jgi:hypothetical protein
MINSSDSPHIDSAWFLKDPEFGASIVPFTDPFEGKGTFFGEVTPAHGLFYFSQKAVSHPLPKT